MNDRMSTSFLSATTLLNDKFITADISTTLERFYYIIIIILYYNRDITLHLFKYMYIQNEYIINSFVYIQKWILLLYSFYPCKLTYTIRPCNVTLHTEKIYLLYTWNYLINI